MTDCPNAEMRDRLPDLLHERLDARARAMVMSHVAQCAECRAELTVLREARIALTSDMRAVDVDAVAAAVIARVSAPTTRTAPWQRRARIWMDWRVAASIALVAAGAASFAILRAREGLPQLMQPDVAVAVPPLPKPAPVVPTNPKPVEQSPATPPAVAAAELSAAGGVGDLSDSDLRALLNDLQSIDAEPATDPEPVSVRITVPGRGEID